MPKTSTVLLITTLAAIIVSSQAMYLEKRVPPSSYLQPREEAKKRPFCNAFTGCGRKRSSLPALPNIPDPQQETENLGTLLDLSAEPAVENLSRQIMSEAKLWEAIQEANMEIMRQKQDGSNSEEEMSAQSLGGISSGKCALPSCIAI